MLWRQLFSSKKITYILVIVISLILCGLPLLNLVRIGFDVKGLAVLGDDSWLKAIRTTLVLAGGTTLFSLLLGMFCAYFVVRTDLPFAKILKPLLLTPYIIPTALSAIAWTILANPGVGWLKPVYPGVNIYTLTGVIFVETLYWYTFAFLTVSTALEALDTSLEESARMCGATPVQVFRFVTFPLLRPAILGSALIIFPCVVSSFGIPAIVGSPGKVQVLTTRLYQLVKIGTPDAIIQAMTVSLPIVLSAFLLLFFAERRLGRLAFATLSGKATRRNTLSLKVWRWPVFLILCFLIFVAVILPNATLIITSLMRSFGDKTLSFEHYVEVLKSEETLASLSHSGLLAVTGGLILTALAFFISYFRMKTRFVGRHALANFVSLPYAAPGTILALALLFTLTGWTPFVLILIAYLAKYLSHAIKTVTPAVANIHSSLEESARVCGAGWFKTIRKIWLPLLRSAFSSCFFLMLAPLFSELTMSVLLADSSYPTIGMRLFHLQEYESPNQAAVLAVVVLVLVLVMNGIVKKLSRGRVGV